MKSELDILNVNREVWMERRHRESDVLRVVGIQRELYNICVNKYILYVG